MFKKFVFLLVFSVGSLSAFSQKASPDYAFLANYTDLQIEAWMKSKKAPELSKALRRLAEQIEKFFYQGSLPKAEALLRPALKLSERVDDAFILGKIRYFDGLVRFEFKGERDNRTALDSFIIAAEYFAKADTETSKFWRVKAILEKADFLIKSAQFADAARILADIRTAFELSQTLGSEYLAGRSLKTLGLFYFYKREFLKALACFEKAERILTLSGDVNELLEINTFSIHLFRNLGRRTAAFDIGQNAERLFRTVSAPRRRMLSLFARGGLYNSSGDAPQAIKFFREAQQIAFELGDINRVLSLQYTIGTTYQWEGETAQAELELQKVLTIAEKHGVRPEDLLRRTRIDMTAVLEDRGKAEEARRILEQIEKNLGDNLTTRNIFYQRQARFFIRQNDLTAARKSLESVKRELTPDYRDILRNTDLLLLWIDYKTKTISPDETLKKLDQKIAEINDAQMPPRQIGANINYLEEFIFPFQFKTLIELEKNNIENALRHADSYKSRWLIGKMSADESFGTTDKNRIVSTEARALREKIAEKLMISAFTGAENADPELQNLLQTHHQTTADRRDVSALTEKVDATELSSENLNSISSMLSERAVIAYSFTNEYPTAFVLRKGRPIKAFELEITEKLLKVKVEKWIEEIAGQQLGFKKEGRELYELLIKPLETEIADASQLIIIPDQILWRVPFQALIDPAGRYLIQNFPISFAPSLKVLQTLQSRPEPENRNIVLGLANAGSNQFTSLPQAEKEVRNLLSVYASTNILMRRQATETALKKNIENVDILHLAVHGKLDEAEPLRSSVILTKDAQNDGNFEIEEILGLKKSPALVILSACSTHRGQVFKGEGLLSLTWAFLAAGSRNVIGTQWEIDDSATVEQMNDFHRQYRQNRNIAQALQFSALRQIEKPGLRNHPFYWAGFMSVGGF